MVLDKSTKYNRFYYKFGIIALAFSFSWLSSLLIFLLFGNNFVELFLIAGFYFVIKSGHSSGDAIKKTLQSDLFQKLVVIVGLFTIIGIIVSGWNFPDPYADFRANMTFVFIILLNTSSLWSNNKDKESFIVELLVWVCLFDVITLPLRPYFGFTFTKQNISIIAPAILAVYFLRKEKFTICLFFAGIMTYEAAVAFFRNYYIISILTFVLIILIVFQNLYKKRVRESTKFKSIFLVVVMVVVGIVITPIIYDYWTSDGSRMIHSINRSEEFVSGEAAEKERINSMGVVLSEPGTFILPHGIGWRAYIKTIEADFKHVDIISSMDSSIFYIGYHYGLIVLLIVLIYLIQRVVASFNTKREGFIFSMEVRICFLVLFCASFVTQGSMLTIIPTAYVYATLYSLVVKPF